MKRLDELYDNFVRRINLIFKETIDPFLGGGSVYGPTEIELINTEFCYTFIHSALEGYVESICDIYYRVMKDLFDKNKILNNCMASLLLLYDEKNIEKYESNDDFIRDAIEKRFTMLNRNISRNHGVSKKYLITMLPYVGLNLPEDRLINSIEAIAITRGDFAHNFKVKIIKTSEDAFDACNDVLDFAKILYDDAYRGYNLYKKLSVQGKINS